eukprot:g10463.t1
MKTYFCIIGKGDTPIYETQLSVAASKVQKEGLIQFIIHAALDCVDQKLDSSQSTFLKIVDKFNDVVISAFVTPGHTKFMLLHGPKTDENSTKGFFTEVYELYLKILLNPFYEKNTMIQSSLFDLRVKQAGERHLPS